MIEKITHGGKLYAVIVRSSYEPDNVQFITSPDNPLQVGIMKHGPGTAVKPHIHRKSQKTVNEIQEVLVIQRGKVVAKFYDDHGTEVSHVTLESGDSILLLAGGHGFEFLEDTKMLEVKQGPYDGIIQDKILL